MTALLQLLRLRLALWLLSGVSEPAALEHRDEPDTPGAVVVGTAQRLQALDDRLAVMARQLDRELANMPDRIVARLYHGGRPTW